MRGCRYDRDGVRNPDSSHFHNSKRHHDGESPSYGNQDGRLSLAGDRDAKPLGHDPHDTLYSNTNLRKRSCGKPTKSGSGKPGANGNSYKPIALRWPFLVALGYDDPSECECTVALSDFGAAGDRTVSERVTDDLRLTVVDLKVTPSTNVKTSISITLSATIITDSRPPPGSTSSYANVPSVLIELLDGCRFGEVDDASGGRRIGVSIF
ncbi:hypothetical protein CIB48_g4817 [Xylaria polymorpha]|nr:hypothetical protein CIB48_g4817 [Xylaria polymorpha]